MKGTKTMDRFKLMSALRGLDCDIERVEIAISHAHFARQPIDPEQRRTHRALTGQYEAVLAKLGGHPTISEWAAYNEDKRELDRDEYGLTESEQIALDSRGEL
jgi:exosortase/archaeosortase